MLTKTPLKRFNVLRSIPLTAFEASSVDFLTPCKLTMHDPNSENEARATVSSTTIGPINLVYATAETGGSGMAVEYTRQESNYVITFALTGTNQIVVRDELALCSTVSAAILSPQMVAGMHVSGDYAQLHLRIERSALERHLEQLLNRTVTKPIRFQLDMDLTSPTLKSWLRGVAVLLDDLDEPFGLSSAGKPDPWSDFLMTGLLLAQPHSYSELLMRQHNDNFRPLPLKRAVEFIQSDPASDLSLDQLCSVAGVGARSLQRYFRDYLSTSPREYVQSVRLSRVHDDLQAGTGGTVAEVAYRWGFTHVPRFAGAYQQRYGVPPSVTLRGIERASFASGN